MRLLGVLGGMGWSATAEYYRRLNEGVEARLGGLHSARVLINSVDFQPVDDAENAGDWDGMARILIEGAQSLEEGGAEAVLIAANTMHAVADQVSASVDVPFLHIAEATATAVQGARQRKVGLVATATTMAGDFYTKPFEERGIEVILPLEEERPEVDRMIYEELVHGIIKDSSRKTLRQILHSMADRGAEGIVLAGTEIGLLVDEDDSRVPMHDTTEIHVEQALDWMLSGS
ncbi:aspartate/glutamate racemase family protein [Janibacter cremeus]|uniref:aspartate/glutamate racemase family protein n=1 Tax=Janibacter cremeus TaxID=1285192 RepID=UPI0023F72075|nr:aspartate/glutamate racemase family protein [Janibacter cremeus]WEV76608.1 aspartate/glutamate racemase family protein [Janibacter cremeus]